MKNEAHIEKAIEAMWRQHHNATTITLIANHLESSNDPISQNIGRLLYSYTKKVVMAVILSRLVRWILKEI